MLAGGGGGGGGGSFSFGPLPINSRSFIVTYNPDKALPGFIVWLTQYSSHRGLANDLLNCESNTFKMWVCLFSTGAIKSLYSDTYLPEFTMPHLLFWVP